MVAATAPRLPDNTLRTAVPRPLTQEDTMVPHPRPHILTKDTEARHPITTRVEDIPDMDNSSMVVDMGVRRILETTLKE